jgi:L-ascorbate metabolism protein UlaG (beta-lactamase superfamily)
MQAHTQVTYIGHATTLIEMDGIRLLTDPLLRGQVIHLRHRNPPVEPVIYQDIDAVLISHLHFDHFHLPSLRLLPSSTRLIVPRGAARLVARFHQVEELGIGETTTVGPLTIRATYALHAGRRYPLGPVTDCLGFVIGGHYSLYFAGDTDLFPEMAGLVDQLDVALLPIWGWGPTLGPGHLDPHRAAEALTLLQPRLAIPIHWGSLHPFGLGWLKPGFLTEPPLVFVRQAAHIAPEVKIHVVNPGQTISLKGALNPGD